MRIAVLFMISLVCTSLSGQLQSPGEFLPHQLGEHFTPHHLIVDYFEDIAEKSPRVTLVRYGTTNQDRPLIAAIVTSEENHARLNDIRENNLRLAGLIEGEPDESLKRTIVWLSFSVHGNEAAGTESAPHVLHDLVDPTNQRTKAWLDNTVVIIDPSVNPDGNSRYTNWVRDVTMDENNPDIQDIEHNEPWPGGRVNHYLFDLNRDWAWQTQKESQHRMKLFNQWLPHVHADLHEMGHESPYFFAPASKPYHKYITEWQRDFQETIGKNHAKYFDAKGWLYFTKEVFDLFYPSYGDTYPTYSGAIGMTYEQGGSRVGGRGVKLKNGEILTLADRIEHHRTTALSTVEVTSINSDQVLGKFEDFYKSTSSNPPGEYRTYIIKSKGVENRVKQLASLLDKQDIRYGTVSKKMNATGYDYHEHKETSVEVEPGDLVVSALQPKAVLTQILLDPSAELEDSVTYDITAWSLPYAYDLQAVASKKVIQPDTKIQFNSPSIEVEDGYAWLVPWKDLSSSQLVAGLLDKGVSLRTIPKAATFDGRQYPAGTVAITKADNRSMGNKLLETIREVVNERHEEIFNISTGFAEAGYDLGSGRVDLIEKPKVATLSGDGISSNSHGQIKWYFDRVLDYPLSIIDIDDFGRVDLDKYNTLVLPEGYYGLSKSHLEKIGSWVSGGGKVIAVGSATRAFVDKEGFSLKRYATDEEKSDDKKINKEADLAARYNHYSDRERNNISEYVPGAIFKLEVDQSHPLGFGLGEQYYSLRTSSIAYPLLIAESNVIRHPKKDGMSIGFAGAKIKNRLNDTVAFAVEGKGRGNLIYMTDNPLFRGFWYEGMFLFSNALFQVN